MMSGPTLGNAALTHQELFDKLQVNIADFDGDPQLKNIVYSTELRNIPGELTEFSLAVRAGKLTEGEIVKQLESMATKALRTLGRIRDLEAKGTTYRDSRTAIIKNFYRMARHFGVQIELSSRLDKWEKEYPHTEDPNEWSFQEQKEEAFKAVEARFSTMYGNVTKDVGFESEDVLAASMKFIHEVMVGDQSGPMAYFLGTGSKFPLNAEEQKKRGDVMKEKLRPMILDALAKDARKATKVIFQPLIKEMFPDLKSIKGKTASSIADEMITDQIRLRCRKSNGKYSEYRPLAYYWPQKLQDFRDPRELRQNIIHLVQAYWGPELKTDKHTDGQLGRAQKRIDADPKYFSGYFVPVSAPKPSMPPTVREGKGATTSGPVVQAPDGESNIHDIAALQAQLAAKTGAHALPKPAAQLPDEPSGTFEHTSTGSQPPMTMVDAMTGDMSEPSLNRKLTTAKSTLEHAPTVPQPPVSPVSFPKREPSVMIAPAPIAPSQRDIKTDPPARPQRPDINFPGRDPEATQTSQHKKRTRFAKWVQRGVFAVAAALGIVAAGSIYKAGTDSTEKTTSSEVGNNKPAPAGTGVTAVAQNTAPTATVAPVVTPSATAVPPVALNQNPAPVVNPPVAPPTKVDTSKPPATAEYLAGIADQDLQQIVAGEKAIGGPYSTDISKPFMKKAKNNTDLTKRAEALKNIGELHRKINRGAFASYMKRFARLSPAEVQDIVRDKSNPEHNLLTYLMRSDKTKMGMGPDISRWQSKIAAVDASGNTVYENGKVKYVNYEERFEEEMKMYDENFEGNFKAFGLDKRAPGNIHMGAWAGDKVSTYKDGEYLWYVQRLAEITGVELPKRTAALDPQGGGNVAPQNGNPQNAEPQKGKTGFNMFAPDRQFPGNIPTNILPGQPNVVPASQYAAAPQVAPAPQIDQLDADFAAFNASKVVKTAQKKTAYDYQMAKEVEQHVKDEDQKLIDFETKRRSRGFFTKLADAGSYIWSGVTPEERSQGMKGMGGIRNLFMTDAKRQAELQKRADALAAMETPVEVAEVKPVVNYEQPYKTEKEAVASINRLRDQIMAADEMEKIDAGWDTIAAEHAQKAEKKKALRAELDGKMEKLFAKGKLMQAERGPAPLIDIRKTYKVAVADKSIKFLLERQIQLSDLSEDAKGKALVAVQEMIRSNGAFIESYKMHADGSRDLTLKDEWRTKLNEAAGIRVAMITPTSKEEDVADQKEAMAA